LELVLDLSFEELALFEGPLPLHAPCIYVVWTMVPGMHSTRRAMYVGCIERGGTLAPSAEERVHWRMETPPAGRIYVSLMATAEVPPDEAGRRDVVNRLRAALAPAYERAPLPAVTSGHLRRRVHVASERHSPAPV
jgi:hypothetical protein